MFQTTYFGLKTKRASTRFSRPPFLSHPTKGDKVYFEATDEFSQNQIQRSARRVNRYFGRHAAGGDTSVSIIAATHAACYTRTCSAAGAALDGARKMQFTWPLGTKTPCRFLDCSSRASSQCTRLPPAVSANNGWLLEVFPSKRPAAKEIGPFLSRFVDERSCRRALEGATIPNIQRHSLVLINSGHQLIYITIHSVV